MTFPITIPQNTTTRSAVDQMAHRLRYELDLPIYCSTLVDPLIGPVYRIEEHDTIGTAPHRRSFHPQGQLTLAA